MERRGRGGFPRESVGFWPAERRNQRLGKVGLRFSCFLDSCVLQSRTPRELQAKKGKPCPCMRIVVPRVVASLALVGEYGAYEKALWEADPLGVL